MLNFYLKMCIREYPILYSLYNFFSANVSIFYSYLLLKIKALCFYISTENQALLALFYNKSYLFFEVFYSVFKCKKIPIITFFCFLFFYLFVTNYKIFTILINFFFFFVFFYIYVVIGGPCAELGSSCSK